MFAGMVNALFEQEAAPDFATLRRCGGCYLRRARLIECQARPPRQ
jgi:hypothetical protein